MTRPDRTLKKQAYRIVFWQLIVIMGLALILFLLKGLQSGLSALTGGLAYGLPNLAFVWRVFNHTGAQAAKRFMTAFVIGEGAKLFFSGLLFALAVKYLPVSTIYTILGFCGAIVAFWMTSFWVISHEQGVS